MSKPKEKKLFVCALCGAQLSSNFNLKMHLESNCSTVKKFNCEICSRNFLTSNSLKIHIKTVHSEEKKFVCSHCAKGFSSKGELVRHERSHNKDKPFQCSECQKSFSYRESLVTHSTIHTGVKPYACENCQKTFSCIGNLIKHRKVRPDTCGRDEFKMQKINNRARVKLEKNITTVTLPMNDMIIEDPIVYEEVIAYDDNNPCELVNGYSIIIPNETIQEVQVDEGMLDMMEIIHEDNSQQEVEERLEFVEQYSIKLKNEEKPNVRSESVQNSQISLEEEEISQYMKWDDQKYCCKLCPKIYQKKIISIKHLKKDHDIIIKSFNYDDSNRYRKPQKNQSFTCNYCPKKFTTSKMAERHQIVHGPSGNLIHKCSCCSEWFENLTKLEIHQSSHEDRLKCNDCMRKFDHPEKLLSHKKYAHSGKNAVTKKYVFVCTLCGRNFNSRVALSDHERSNCGKNPIYTCSYCNKKYHSAGSLKCHLTIHTLEFNFQCDHCSKKFRTKGQLQVHQRVHTKDRPFQCKFCDASFSHRESFLTHHTIHTKIKRFQCEQCCAQFSCISNLLAHRRSKKQKGCGDSRKIQKVENALTTLNSIDSYMEKE